jgi:hypothetical protein
MLHCHYAVTGFRFVNSNDVVKKIVSEALIYSDAKKLRTRIVQIHLFFARNFTKTHIHLKNIIINKIKIRLS